MISIFGQSPEAERIRLSHGFEHRILKKNDILINEGDEPTHFFIIWDGKNT
jgi:hypothetical protein